MNETRILTKSKKAQRIIALCRNLQTKTNFYSHWLNDKEMIVEAWKIRADDLQIALDKIQILINAELQNKTFPNEKKLCGCQSAKGFNPDLPDNCGECPNTRTEWIVCPECSMNQEAVVIPTIPFETRIHECEQCNHIITESEWLLDVD